MCEAEPTGLRQRKSVLFRHLEDAIPLRTSQQAQSSL
jgi:hypothetical protein